MKKAIGFLLLILVCVFSIEVMSGCANKTTIIVELEDLYYEEFYVWAGQTFDILVAKVAIENEGNEDLRIIDSYVSDDFTIDYRGMLLYKKWTKNACLCNTNDIDYDKIDLIHTGEKTRGYFMAFEEVPIEVEELDLTIVTETGSVSIPLGEASSIRRIELPKYR